MACRNQVSYLQTGFMVIWQSLLSKSKELEFLGISLSTLSSTIIALFISSLSSWTITFKTFWLASFSWFSSCPFSCIFSSKTQNVNKSALLPWLWMFVQVFIKYFHQRQHFPGFHHDHLHLYFQAHFWHFLLHLLWNLKEFFHYFERVLQWSLQIFKKMS